MTKILSRQRQFGIKKEAVEGVAETLAAANYSLNFKAVEPPASAIPSYRRELMRASLSKDKALRAVRSVTLKATVELAGGTASVASPWHDAIEACGFVKSQLKVVDIGSVSGGVFIPGDVIGDNAVLASATKTGILICIAPGTPDRAVYIPLTGAFANTDTLYNYQVSQASAAVDSAPANAGWGFRLQSETAAITPASATVEVRDGQNIFRSPGARGMVEFSIAHNAPVLMMFEFNGPLDLPDEEYPAAGFITGIQPITVTPVMGKSFPVLFDDYSPVFTQLSVKVENTLTLRPNVNIGSVADSGYMATCITDRNVKVTCDPEHPPVATRSWLNRAAGSTTERLYVQAGRLLAGDAAGTAVFIGPQLQSVEDLGMGDRNGIVIDNLSMELLWNGTDDDELIVAHVFI